MIQLRTTFAFLASFAITLGVAQLAFGASADCHLQATCSNLQQDLAGNWYCAGTITVGPTVCSGTCSPCKYSTGSLGTGDPICNLVQPGSATCKCGDLYAPCVTCANGGPSYNFACHDNDCIGDCQFVWSAPAGGAGTSGNGHCVCLP